MLPLTQNEAYVCTCGGRMWFMPGVHCLKARHLDAQKTERVMREVRTTAWLLWRIHLAFRQMASRQGMGAYLALLLTKSLPQVGSPSRKITCALLRTPCQEDALLV